MYNNQTCHPQNPQDQWVVEHAQLVNKIARHLIARLPAHFQLDDLIQAGMMGLLEAAHKYDSDKGASFETFASIRIRGAMLDEVRRQEWTPRTLYKQGREISLRAQKFEQEMGRRAGDAELAGLLQMDISLFHQLQDKLAIGKFVEIDGTDESLPYSRIDGVSDVPNPLDDVQKMAFQNCLAKAIADLPEREAMVLSLYYDKELNLKEVGLVLGISESRVCQIHSQAMSRLQLCMQDWQ